MHLREAAGFPACPFCGVALALDRTGVRPHVLYRPRVTPPQILPLLRRWAERWGVAAPVGPVSPRLVYYPFWRYTREGPHRLIPAWSTLDTQWEALRLPDAEQVFFDALHVQGAEVVEPTVPEAAARARALGEAAAAPGDLVHLPVYEATIRIGSLPRRVAIEACAGTVVTPAAGEFQGQAPGTARRAWPFAAGGLVAVAAAAVIRPLGIAMIAVAVLAALLYGALLGEGRRGGA